MNADSNGHGCCVSYANCKIIHTERAFVCAPLFVAL